MKNHDIIIKQNTSPRNLDDLDPQKTSSKDLLLSSPNALSDQFFLFLLTDHPDPLFLLINLLLLFPPWVTFPPP